MSLLGATKGTDLEQQVELYLKAEAQGVAMYYGLARLATESGLDDVAEVLVNLANDEARHAGLYTVLNGHLPQDILGMLAQVAKRERAAKEPIHALAAQARLLGLSEVASEIEAAAQDEWHHGEVLEALVKKHTDAQG